MLACSNVCELALAAMFEFVDGHREFELLMTNGYSIVSDSSFVLSLLSYYLNKFEVSIFNCHIQCTYLVRGYQVWICPVVQQNLTQLHHFGPFLAFQLRRHSYYDL